ncbi:MAG: C-GCAxxG-C-C family protein [Tractidigestivibacter sp.]|jgi:C_GCAxxG_C_C family probable redox protein|uniref:C-GCAxxG-C-C family protein n=1 Tax=Tractidigestivibacter sp. TaxID=2847320 RepID=UPI003D8B7991
MANFEIGVREVSPHKVQRLAESYYKGGFFCDEAVMSAIRDSFGLDVPEYVIAMVSGMSVGVGKSGCMCGAANGGVAVLGLLYGRTEQNGPSDPKVQHCMSLTHELHDWFKDANGKHALCCRVLTREFNMGQGEHKEQCIWFTGLCAWKVATIICREEGIANLDAGTEGGGKPLPRRAIRDVEPLRRKETVA